MRGVKKRKPTESACQYGGNKQDAADHPCPLVVDGRKASTPNVARED
jgi:hypothetical protein